MNQGLILKTLMEEPRETTPGRVVDFLRVCLAARRLSAVPDWRARIDLIAFKIHVAGRVHTDYGPDWSQSAGERLLPRHWLLGVIVVLLRAADQLEERDVAAKCLNAALAALDLYKAFEDIEIYDDMSIECDAAIERGRFV